MLGLGLGGVVVIATQANRPHAPQKSGASPQVSSATQRAMEAKNAMEPGPTRARPTPMRPVMTPDAGAPAPRPVATPDAGVGASPDAGANVPQRPTSTPDAAVATTGPPKHTGPTPALVVEFSVRSTRVPKKTKRAIRKLVRERGYKGVRYKLTGYGAERRRAKHNRALARRRCRKIARLIRKRGVSRRWIDCGPPVFRSIKRKPTEADKAPEWRRVEIRVEKP